MTRRPPRSTLFPSRRSSDLSAEGCCGLITSHKSPALLSAWGAPVTNQPNRCRNALHLLLLDRKSTRLNSSHVAISYAVFCLKKKKKTKHKYYTKQTTT